MIYLLPWTYNSKRNSFSRIDFEDGKVRSAIFQDANNKRWYATYNSIIDYETVLETQQITDNYLSSVAKINGQKTYYLIREDEVEKFEKRMVLLK